MSTQNENEIFSNSSGNLPKDTDEILKSNRSKDDVITDYGTDKEPYDIDGYIFLKASSKKKKRVNHTSADEDNISGVSDEIVVRSQTTNRMSKSHHYGHSGYHSNHHKHHKHHHKHKKMKLWKKILIAFASILLALVLLIVGTITYFIYNGSQELFNEEISVSAPDNVPVQEDGKYVVYNGYTYKFNENITNILCMGIDKRNIDNSGEMIVNGTGGQADALVLISVDTKTGKITMTNISREIMTDVTIYTSGGSYLGSEIQQICLAYAYGDGNKLSCENTVSSVKRLFYNIPINTYFALDLDGIAAINDSVGGVDVVSPETIAEFIQGESYHLIGDQAEHFVRTRNTKITESNNYRMQRQQVYIKSFMDTAISQTKKDLGVPLALFNESSGYSCTNLNPSKVSYLAQAALTCGSMEIETVSVPGEIVAGEKYAEFHVNEKDFYEMFLNIFYTKL